MTTMKSLLCATFLLSATPFACAAQQAPAQPAPAPLAADAARPNEASMASDAQIDRLMAAMHMSESVAAMLPQVEAAQQRMVEQAIAGRDLSDAQRARIEGLFATTRQRVREALAWDHLEPVYRDVYKRTFSREEMEAMIGFYGSPAGQSVVAKMPRLMQLTMEATQALLTPMLAQLRQDVAGATTGK